MPPGLYRIPNRRGWRRAGGAQGSRALPLPGGSAVRAARGTRRSRLGGQGTRPGQCSFGTTARDDSPGQQPGTQHGAAGLAQQPPCAAAITGGTHGVRHEHLQWGRALIRSSRIPLIPPELWGFTGVPEQHSLCSFWEYKPHPLTYLQDLLIFWEIPPHLTH